MDKKQALRATEQLRMGIPPTGMLEDFTVGRSDEIQWLDSHLHAEDKYALLLKANYGSGKTHLLKLTREKALKHLFVPSLVTLDANSGVRFNRMDQIFGAIMRNIELPYSDGTVGGLSDLLDHFVDKAQEAEDDEECLNYEFWKQLTNDWDWGYSEQLTSPPLFVALRAWANSDAQGVRSLILDWLCSPETYRSQRSKLYTKLVSDLKRHFRDPRSDYEMYNQQALTFQSTGSIHCWNALEDFHNLIIASELKGLVVLFDEFEDVLTNLNRINLKEAAFWNLFRFVAGDRFSGKTFYGVTPDFANKCVEVLLEKCRWDFDHSQFKKLPAFSMSPLQANDLMVLAQKIIKVHEIAYDYSLSTANHGTINRLVANTARSSVQDRTRHAIKRIVEVLDDALE